MLLNFVLSMPGNNSWNGHWSGADKMYANIKNIGNKPIDISKGNEILNNSPYSYDFGDGWKASISVIQVSSEAAAKIRRKSKGFCGYEWMIESIIANREIIV